jgi:CheY-like chemotaxis protein
VLVLNEAVESTIGMLRRLIGEDIILSWNPAADLWPVKADPSQIHQVVTNLCINARNAIRGTGKIGVATANAVISPESCKLDMHFTPGEYVTLTVTDDGCGMREEQLAQLFEPFYTTKPTGEGTGLGLATVYGIVKQNGGHIDVQSAPGQGSTFRIYLPRTSDKVSTTARTEPRNDGTHKTAATILVAEDHETIRRTVEAFLARTPYKILVAESPEKALQMASDCDTPVDLLVTDVVMPKMNGRELAAKLREIHPAIRVLYISGYTADVISQRGVIAEDIDFLGKPFQRQALLDKIIEILAR